MGNILFLTGFGFLSGLARTLEFFGLGGSKWRERWRSRWRGIATFLGGILMVLCGWTMTGMLVEGFGFLNLFGSFFPLALQFFRAMPVVGTFLNLPVVAGVLDKLVGVKSPGTMV
jgi:hypothetical protein